MAMEVGADAPIAGGLEPPADDGPAAPARAPGNAETPSSNGPVVRFFAAVFLSLYGDWLTTVALLVVLFQTTHNPAGPAGYILARVAPRVVGPWLGGSLADRFSPRRIMVSASLVQGALTATLVASDRARAVWAIYAAVAVAQFAGALARPSLSSMLPQLVPDRSLPRANALYWLLFSTSIFVGPALGAALLGPIGADSLFVIDAASFTLAAVLIATLPDRSRAETAGTRLNGSFGTWAGLRVAFRDPLMRGVAAANFASGVAVTVTQALLVVGAHERFGGDASVGYLYSGVGIGGTLGGIIALRITPPRARIRFAVFVAIIVSVAALAGYSAALSLTIALPLLAISSLGGTSFDIWGATEVQRRAPPGFLGRFNAVIWISQFSGMLVGALWALGTASLLHWDRAIQYACAAVLILVGVVWLFGRPSFPPVDEHTEP